MSWNDIQRHFPAGGLFALVVILLGEAWFCTTTEPLTGLPFFQPTSDDATVVAKRSLLPETHGAVVLVGDSSCMMGLVPAEIKPVLGQEVVNLGLLITLTNAGFCELAQDALEQSPPPRAIVVAILPQTLGQSLAKAEEFGILGRTLIAYREACPNYSPTIADWRAWFFRKHRLNRFPPEFGGSYAAYQAMLHSQRGHLAERGTYSGTKHVRESFTLDEFSLAPLRTLQQQAASKNVPVYLWFSPSPSDALTAECRQSLSDFRHRVQQALPGIRLLQEEIPLWEPQLFGSVTHLTHAGAKTNSKQLAECLPQLE